MDLGYLKELVEYWRSDYDWQVQEHALNQFHQYTMEIGDINIHFIHMRAKRPNSVPILLLHGLVLPSCTLTSPRPPNNNRNNNTQFLCRWPGSFYEFYKVINPLIAPQKHGGKKEHSFHVVVPSLPGTPHALPLPPPRAFCLK